MYTYPGNIHIHSNYSDGSGSIEEIVADAAAAGLSYIIIADHNSLDGLPEQAVRHGVVVLVGTELNREKNHYLVLNLDKPVPGSDENPQELIDRVARAGGLGFLAHPFEKGSPYIEKGKAQPWKNWPIFRFHGMEIWNYTSHWRGFHPSPFKTIYHFFFDRKGAMSGPPPELLALWDCYNISGHRVVGIGSSDAHAFPYKLGPISIVIFPYRYLFKTINTYIVLENELNSAFTTARRQIIDALQKGHCYSCFDSLHSGNGFRFFAGSLTEPVIMGGAADYKKGLQLHIDLPSGRSITRLVRNGRVINEFKEKSITIDPPGPGVYRIEVLFRRSFHRLQPWIYSNPIFLEPVLQ